MHAFGALAKGSAIAAVREHAVALFQRRFWRKVRRLESGCWEWIGSRWKPGYGMVYVGKKTYKAHRVAYELVRGHALPRRLGGLHSCDHTWCVNPDHVSGGRPKQNTAQMLARGRRGPTPPKNPARGFRNFIHRHPEVVRGERNPRAKLKWSDVRAIRQSALRGVRYGQLAERYGVTAAAIGMIVRRQTWRGR